MFGYGDLTLYSDFLDMFLSKEFADPKRMFRKICRQFPFEFLLFDLSREKCQYKFWCVLVMRTIFFKLVRPLFRTWVIFIVNVQKKAMKMFVHFCKDHPFGSTILNVISSVDEVETNCFCKKKGFSRTKSNVQKRPLQFKL